MRRTKNILLTATLSILIVYLGVGIPLVQYRCTDCAERGGVSPLISIAEAAAATCDCGCDAPRTKAETCGCCCSTTTNDDDEHQGRCSTVRIEKISLPTLTDRPDSRPLPGQPVLGMGSERPVAQSLDPGDGAPSLAHCRAPSRRPPRSTIHLLCTLLI